MLDLSEGFDVADSSAWEGVGRVELACLNAGHRHRCRRRPRALRRRVSRRMLATNVGGVVFGVRRMAQVMPEGAAIVVTASLAGLTTMATDPIYAGHEALRRRLHAVGRAAAGRARDPDPGGLPCDRRHADAGPDAESAFAQAGIDVLTAEEIADVVLTAAHDGSTGQAWTCLPGRAAREASRSTASSSPHDRTSPGRSCGPAGRTCGGRSATAGRSPSPAGWRSSGTRPRTTRSPTATAGRSSTAASSAQCSTRRWAARARPCWTTASRS